MTVTWNTPSVFSDVDNNYETEIEVYAGGSVLIIQDGDDDSEDVVYLTADQVRDLCRKAGVCQI